MTPLAAQAGKKPLVALALLASFVFGLLAQPSEARTELERREESPVASNENVISFYDLLDRASDLLPSFGVGEREGSGRQLPESGHQHDAAEPKAPNEKPIEAKRIETKPVEPKQVDKTPEKPPEPYKVYSSPYVPDDDEPVRTWTSGGRVPQERAYDKDAPVSGQDLRGAGPADPARLGSSPLPGPATVPVTGMSRQLFPIFPLNASPDMPPQMLPVAVNRNLEADQSMVTRAIIGVHDLSRNASESLTTLTTLAGAENETTLIVAPQFPLEIDIERFLPYLPEKGQAIARWLVSRNSGWQTGEDSLAKPPYKGISSFTAIDLLMLFLADKGRFPALQQVVMVGHGVGGDFVQRYAAIGQAPDILALQRLSVRFLAANPSSYLYLTSVRPSRTLTGFAMPDASQCPNMQHYPYGLGGLIPYARRIGPEAIRLGYIERRVMYLLGEGIVSDPFLDQDCAAMAQGKDRLARGRNYERYLRMSFGDQVEKTQSFTLVPQTGYDPVALLGSYCGMAMLFGDGICPTSMMDKKAAYGKTKGGQR